MLVFGLGVGLLEECPFLAFAWLSRTHVCPLTAQVPWAIRLLTARDRPLAFTAQNANGVVDAEHKKRLDQHGTR